MRVSAFAILALFTLCALGTAVLITSLYHVQVSDVATFRQRLANQTTRRISVPGRRGRILARHGEVLADLRPRRDIVCHLENFRSVGGLSNTLEAVEAELVRFSSVLRLPCPFDAQRVRRHLQRNSALPLVVWRDVEDAVLARLAERNIDFPAFSETCHAERVYPYGSVAAHILGYTGRETPVSNAGDEVVHFLEELDIRGRSGVERFYNDYLSGAPGIKLIQVDARGFRTGKDIPEREPAPGPDLRLTLDLGIQQALEQALEGVVGAGVVLDPRNGEVLALASSPTFNPAEWNTHYRQYLNDNSRPLYNRAVSGVYPPGSIFKPITSLAALNRRGTTSEAFTWSPETPYSCAGIFTYGTMRLKCWDIYGHGPIALREAIAASCNAYFCDLGRQIGTNALFQTAKMFGLGTVTGIDLGGEAEGQYAGTPWYPGTTCQTAIGQGLLQVTPLQMAVVCAAFANGGKIFRPHLHLRQKSFVPPEPVRTITGRPADLELIRQGMRDVVETGTGRRIRTRFTQGRTTYVLNVSCAGKTGTAELGRGLKDTWIIAFAPYDHPTVAMAMVVENGESGGKTTAPLAHQVLAHIFGEKEVVQ